MNQVERRVEVQSRRPKSRYCSLVDEGDGELHCDGCCSSMARGKGRDTWLCWGGRGTVLRQMHHRPLSHTVCVSVQSNTGAHTQHTYRYSTRPQREVHSQAAPSTQHQHPAPSNTTIAPTGTHAVHGHTHTTLAFRGRGEQGSLGRLARGWRHLE